MNFIRFASLFIHALVLLTCAVKAEHSPDELCQAGDCVVPDGTLTHSFIQRQAVSSKMIQEEEEEEENRENRTEAWQDDVMEERKPKEISLMIEKQVAKGKVSSMAEKGIHKAGENSKAEMIKEGEKDENKFKKRERERSQDFKRSRTPKPRNKTQRPKPQRSQSDKNSFEKVKVTGENEIGPEDVITEEEFAKEGKISIIENEIVKDDKKSKSAKSDGKGNRGPTMVRVASIGVHTNSEHLYDPQCQHVKKNLTGYLGNKWCVFDIRWNGRHSRYTARECVTLCQGLTGCDAVRVSSSHCTLWKYYQSCSCAGAPARRRNYGVCSGCATPARIFMKSRGTPFTPDKPSSYR